MNVYKQKCNSPNRSLILSAKVGMFGESELKLKSYGNDWKKRFAFSDMCGSGSFKFGRNKGGYSLENTSSSKHSLRDSGYQEDLIRSGSLRSPITFRSSVPAKFSADSAFRHLSLRKIGNEEYSDSLQDLNDSAVFDDDSSVKSSPRNPDISKRKQSPRYGSVLKKSGIPQKTPLTTFKSSISGTKYLNHRVERERLYRSYPSLYQEWSSASSRTGHTKVLKRKDEFFAPKKGTG